LRGQIIGKSVAVKAGDSGYVPGSDLTPLTPREGTSLRAGKQYFARRNAMAGVSHVHMLPFEEALEEVFVANNRVHARKTRRAGRTADPRMKMPRPRAELAASPKTPTSRRASALVPVVFELYIALRARSIASKY